MRTLRAALPVFVLGAGLGLANSATADVVLLSQNRSVTANAMGTTKTSSASGFGDWSMTRLFYQSGTSGYWNGAAQYSTFLPDGATGTGQSVYAEGSVRSEVVGTVARTSAWWAESRFSMTFRADTAHLMNIFISTNATGSGTVTATLTQGSATVWSMAALGNENVMRSLTAGQIYTLEVVAGSSLSTTGSGGDALYNLGLGFSVPGPSALAMVSLSLFLRRRRI